MTRQKPRTTLSPEEALALLYCNTDVPDLSTDTHLEELARLRHESKALAKRVERALGPYLQARVYPRRQVGWQSTSLGLRARLRLLPFNPHIEIDVQTIRTALGLDPEVLCGSEGDAMWITLRSGERLAIGSDADSTRRMVRQKRASLWMAAHDRFATNKYVEDISKFELSPEAVRMAKDSAGVDLANSAIPAWLRQRANGGTPFDDAVARLCERHRLPCSSEGKACLGFYILTDDKETLPNIGFSTTLLSLESLEGGAGALGIIGSFSLSIGAIDEFLTKEDWDELWRVAIRPRQERLLDQRGSKPHGRHRVSLERLVDAMPIYREVVLTGIKPAAALSRLARDGVNFAEGMDASTAFRLVADLRRLLEPRS